MAYLFYGNGTADCSPVNEKYAAVKDPRQMYDMLSGIWCEYTCAPRMRNAWSKQNMTLGQCSITAFLVQDVFGGEVYGVPLKEGGVHCYNAAGGRVFDLTSEQFGDEKLEYKNDLPQTREEHFASDEKRLRYEYLKAEFDKAVKALEI